MNINEIIENFYKHILPITKNIVNLLTILQEPISSKEYKNVGKEIYKKTQDGSINTSEKFQDIIYSDLINLDYNLERLNEIENMDFDSLNESKLLKEVFQKEHAPILNKAVQYAMKYLDVPRPNIILINSPNYTKEHSSFGGYSPGDKSIRVVTYNRNLADLTRSLFHEMTHQKQDIEGRLKPGAGKDGDEWENESNSTAGTMMRKFSRENPEIFEN